MNIKDIFLKIIQEAGEQKVIIDGEAWNIGFNTKINDEIVAFNEDNNALLNINDLDILLVSLEEYVSLRLELNEKPICYFRNNDEKIKFIISFLFINASTEDFLNPILFVKRNIAYLKDNTLSHYQEFNLPLGDFLSGNHLNINDTRQSLMMETPKKITISIIDNNNPELKFVLPEISYGIDNNTCYIYSILNHGKKDQTNSELLKKSKKKSIFLMNY